jgi:hypothetical protein
MYFHQYPLNASFHQFLGPSINNDYAIVYLDSFKTIENCAHKKIPYFIKKSYETNFEGVNKEIY